MPSSFFPFFSSHLSSPQGTPNPVLGSDGRNKPGSFPCGAHTSGEASTKHMIPGVRFNPWWEDMLGAPGLGGRTDVLNGANGREEGLGEDDRAF